MVDYMKLADGTMFEIEEGASVGNIIYDAKSGEDGLRIANAITAENVKHVEFYSNLTEADLNKGVDIIAPTGSFDNLGINNVYFDVEHMQVLISLYEKSNLELRVDALEENLELANEAIDFMAMEE